MNCRRWIIIQSKRMIAVVILFVVIVLAGQFIIYAGPHHSISSSVVRDGTDAHYEFDTDLDIAYQVISMDNSSNTTVRYVAFYDENYASIYYRPDVKESIDWLVKCMDKNSLRLELIDLEELNRIVLSCDTTTAVVFATGILPDSIYTGLSSDPIFKWLKEGGMMYWLGSQLGAEYFDEYLQKYSVMDSDTLFYGASDVTRKHQFDEGSIYNNDLIEGSFSAQTRQYYNECTFGLDISKLSTDFMNLDYNYQGYYSVVFLKYHSGIGTLVVFGGDLKKYAIGADVAMTVAQTLACRTTYDSRIIDYVSGDNAKGVSGTVKCDIGPTDVFMFVSTGDLVYGKNVTV